MKGRGDLRSEETSHDIASQSTDRMDSEDVKRVIDTKHILELSGEVASNGSNTANDDRAPDRNESRGRRNSDQASNGARAETDCGPLAIKSVVHEAPHERTGRGSEVGDYASRHCAQVRRKRRASIETEPANPEEDSAKDDMCHIVRPVWQTVNIVVASALAKHE